jgi:hypothetical protein
MAGCPYCHEMHSVLYRCDAQRKAEAAEPPVTNAPVTPLVTAVTQPLVTTEAHRTGNAARVARWQRAHPEAHREKMRKWRSKRAQP